MRFVRPAKDFEEMNLVITQIKDNLYFITCRQIQGRQELLVGYSEQYAAKRQLSVLQPLSGKLANLKFSLKLHLPNCLFSREC